MSVSDDEIDLRPYILLLFRNWWRIALLAILAGAAGLVIGILQPRTYESTATLLLARSRAALSLAQQFPTVSEPVDQSARMNALLSIAQSDALAFSTLQSIREDLPPELREIDELKERVNLEARGDAILVTASAADPATAAKIANAWAGQTAQAINLAYSGEQPLPDIQIQLQSSRAEYLAAQTNLEIFLKESRIRTLEKQIEEATALFTNMANEHTWRINYYNQRKHAMEDLQVQAGALLRQLQGGNRSAAGDLGDALALLFARAHLLTLSNPVESANPEAASPIRQPSSNLSLSLEINGDSGIKDTTANYVADLQAIVALAEEEKANAEATLMTLTEEVSEGGGNETIENVAARLRDLETQLENEKARQQDLASQRDLSWQAYQALAQKETELKNAAQTSNYVNLASAALPPQNPAPRGALRNALIAGALGLFVGVFGVIAVQWWQSTGRISEAVAPLPTASQKG